MAFKIEKTAQNVQGQFEPGINDADDGKFVEKDLLFPWLINPRISYLQYQCWVEAHLDSGIVTHRPLPQKKQPYDSLGVEDLRDPKILTNTKDGVNTTSRGDWENFTQRMANSHYRFCLKGWAIRVGYQVPIPKLKTVGGVSAIPDDAPVQKGKNVVIANNSGVPVYLATWEQWYTVAKPPTSGEQPPANLAERVDAVPPPKSIAVPVSVPDDAAVGNAPAALLNPLPTNRAVDLGLVPGRRQ